MATINGEISILKSFNKVTAREILIVVSFIVTMFYMLPCKCYAALRCLGRMIRVYCK